MLYMFKGFLFLIHSCLIVHQHSLPSSQSYPENSQPLTQKNTVQNGCPSPYLGRWSHILTVFFPFLRNMHGKPPSYKLCDWESSAPHKGVGFRHHSRCRGQMLDTVKSHLLEIIKRTTVVGNFSRTTNPSNLLSTQQLEIAQFAQVA